MMEPVIMCTTPSSRVSFIDIMGPCGVFPLRLGIPPSLPRVYCPGETVYVIRRGLDLECWSRLVWGWIWSVGWSRLDLGT